MSKRKPKVGLRFNTGKLRWRNVPMFLLKPLMEVGHMGELKYETFNFLNGMYANDLMDSNKRHAEKLENPKELDYDFDPECKGCQKQKCKNHSGLHHAAHMAWNSLVLAYMLVERPDLDDRHKTQVNTKRIKSKRSKKNVRR